MHYFKHSLDELFHDFRLSGDDFICHLLCQRQNPLYPIAKARRQLVILALFLQELNRLVLLLPLICQLQAQTSNVISVTLKIASEIGFNYQVSISCLFHVEVSQPTSAKTPPYLIALFTDPSIDPLVNGAYSFSNISSSWSHERRGSAYAVIIG